MSTYWGYYCKDCNEKTDTWFNHAEFSLSEYFTVWKFVDENQLSSWIEINIMGGAWANWEIQEFLEKHKDHHIMLRNEYNEIKELEKVGINDENKAN